MSRCALILRRFRRFGAAFAVALGASAAIGVASSSAPTPSLAAGEGAVPAPILIQADAGEFASPMTVRSRDVAIGAPDAPVTVIEYASLTCSHCQNFHFNAFPQLKKDYIDAGKVRYILREYPTDNIGFAGFMLARCAGPERFPGAVDLMFQLFRRGVEGDTIREALAPHARQMGMTPDRFDACLSDAALLQAIVKERDVALSEYGVEATPTFFVNGQKIEGNRPYDVFSRIIDAHLGGV